MIALEALKVSGLLLVKGEFQFNTAFPISTLDSFVTKDFKSLVA